MTFKPQSKGRWLSDNDHIFYPRCRGTHHLTLKHPQKGGAMKKRKIRRKDTLAEARQSLSKNVIFDFDIGTLLESPCRTCEMRSTLPDYQKNCQLLAGIQTILADTLNCGHSVLPVETYNVMIGGE
jgi:hypothetical protein